MLKCDEFPLNKVDYNTVRTNKKITYINIECAFDIETTSTYVQDKKVAFMYVWTFGIKDKNFICYGRTWEEFISLCGKLQNYFQLSEERVLVCYIHNMGYEFQFMRKYFEWLNVFSVDERKPIKALCNFYIEFRDSYILSGYSLDKTAENLQHHKIEKLKGNLNYDLIRTHNTFLTDLELDYCNNDVEIILCYINEQIKQYGDITKVPLTNTGRVRKYCKDKCYHSNSNHKKESRTKFYKYRRIMQDLTLKTNEYTMLKRAFQGGFTHANANYMGKVLTDVASIDFTSSYPCVMLAERFPMSNGLETTLDKENGKDLNYYLDKYCLVFDVIFEGLRSKISYDNYISESKCFNLRNPIVNNGRLYSADYVATTVTDVDFRIIESCYEWDTCRVGNIIRYCKGYLPKDLVLSIIELYEDKTMLKGVEGKEVEYLLSKGMLNSVYGMSVTDIVRDEISYTDEWGKTPANVDEQIEKYNESYSRFLYYPWGVWVTAYARRNLWLGIKNIADDYVYSDTDSIKFLNYEKHTEFINWYDDIVIQKLQKMCEHHKIDFNRLKPKTIKGDEKLIGIWDFEGIYSRFKTLGAKRYLVEHHGKLQLTVAGLSKQNGVQYMIDKCNGDFDKVFQMFNDELYIPSENTGKMTHTYIDDEYHFIITDLNGVESEVITKSGVHLEKCDFTLSISRLYSQFLDNFIRGYKFLGTRYK